MKMPTGKMPTGKMPTGKMPTGKMPTGKMPTGKMPTGTLRLRRLALAGAALGLLLVAALPTIAQAAPHTSASTTARNVPATASATPCDLTCVKAFGDKRIAERLDSLSKATAKINDLVSKGHLTNAQAGPLLDQITTNVNGLTALQTKLDGETTLAAAREDVKNIYLNFRIYAVFLPRTRHVVWLDIMTNVDAKLRSIQPKIETAIDKDTSHKDQLNALYADYKTQLGEAEAQIDAAQGQLPVLTPNTFNTDRTAYNNAWKTFTGDCKSAHDALKKAKNDLHQIVMILKADRGTPTATKTP